jgi:hypothetical protein
LQRKTDTAGWHTWFRETKNHRKYLPSSNVVFLHFELEKKKGREKGRRKGGRVGGREEEGGKKERENL